MCLTFVGLDGSVVASGADDSRSSVSSAATIEWFLANARGLRQGCGELRARVSKRRPAFFAITESHLDGDPIRALIPGGYKAAARLDRSKHGGGLLIGCMDHFLVDVLDLSEYNIPKVAEMIGVEFLGVQYILCYTPSSAKAPLLFGQAGAYMDAHPNKQVVWMGDFNAHNPGWIHSTSPLDAAGEAAQEFSEMFGVSNLVDFPTREGNTLDLVLSSIDGVASPDAGLGSSDHLSIWLTFQSVVAAPLPPKLHSVRNWLNAPWDHIRGAVRRALRSWDPVPVGACVSDACSAVDAAVQDLDIILLGILDKYVPMKQMSQVGPAPWWNKRCSNALAYKDRVFQRCREGVLPSWKLKVAIKYARNAQKKAYAVYQRRLCSRLKNSDGSAQEFWELVKEISGLEQSRSSSAPAVEALAEHFQAKMSNAKNEVDSDYCPSDGGSIPLSGLKVRFKTVFKVLGSRVPGKSANGMPPVFLRECAVQLAPSFCRLFKYIVRKAAFPSSWKIGRITPLHKRGPVKVPGNYRPVTVLNGLSTCFEAVMNDQLYAWASAHVPESQFGFLRGCGTSDYGAAVAFPLIKTLEHRGEGILISLDVAGAFDRCWWSRFESRFRARGMRGKALALLKDYLRGRFIQVVAGGQSSSTREIFSGVPQGALWSPILWDLDISELPSAVRFGELLCYADDLSLWYEISDDNRDVILDRINADLASLLVWGADNRTTFEPTKTYSMLVSLRRSTRFEGLDELRMGDRVIKQVSQMKLVGFIFDSKMTWGPMVDMLAKKARCKLGAIRRLRPYLDSQNLKLMYTAFVRSGMEYGSVLYMGAAESHLLKLDKIQWSAQALGGFVIDDLQSRRDAACLKLACKLLAGHGRGSLRDYAPSLVEVHARSRHQVGGLQITMPISPSKYPLECFRRSFLYRMPEIWAAVPQPLVLKCESGSSSWCKLPGKLKRATHSSAL